MATKNPRISVTVTPEAAAVLARLSDLAGGSVSSLVGQLIDTTFPVFERMALALEAAKKLQEHGQLPVDDIRQSMDKAQTRIEEQLGLSLEEMDLGLRPLLDQAEKVSRRGTRAAGGARTPRRLTTPVPVTRGSGTPPSPDRDGGSHAKAHKGKGSVEEVKPVRRGKNGRV